MGKGLGSRATALALAGTLLGVVAQRAPKASASATPGASLVVPAAQSPRAMTRIQDLRARFVLPGTPCPRHALLHATSEPTVLRPALGASGANGFELHGDLLRALIPAEARQAATRTASVALPVRACDSVRLEDDTSHVAVSFRLRGASNAAATTAGGIVLYPGAFAGVDVLHRVHAEGTEDYVVFEQRPAKEEVAYDVDVSRVAGLRLVSNTLELLDAAGAPRLRVAPPYVVDARGDRTEATLTIEGCAFDASPRTPWGREVTSPGASRCGVHVTWRAAKYPAMVDPSWTATGSLAEARGYQTATLLGSGEVLIAGGFGDAAVQVAELYDPTAGTFAATGSMVTARWWHTATLLGSGEVLFAGGTTGSPGLPATASAEFYDPTTGTFAVTGSLTTARDDHTATLLGSGDVLLAGGGNSAQVGSASYAALSSAELYDPTLGTFAAAGTMTTERDGHAAALLGSGQVLLAGGASNDSSGNWVALSSAELYDPTEGTFTATGPMVFEQALRPTATVLGSGQVLLAGGASGDSGGNWAVLSNVELYSPTAGTFTALGTMAMPRFDHTATLLGSGEVLLAGGGTDLNDFATSSAELYESGRRARGHHRGDAGAARLLHRDAARLGRRSRRRGEVGSERLGAVERGALQLHHHVPCQLRLRQHRQMRRHRPELRSRLCCTANVRRWRHAQRLRMRGHHRVPCRRQLRHHARQLRRSRELRHVLLGPELHQQRVRGWRRGRGHRLRSGPRRSG